MSCYIYLPIIVLLLSCRIAVGQSVSLETLLEDLEDAPGQESSLLQLLQDLEQNPLNLNKVSLGELLQIPFLDVASAKALVRFRRQVKQVVSLDSLAAQAGLSKELIEAIRPYLAIKRGRTRPSFEYRLQLKPQLQATAGYQTGTYQSPLALFQKLFWRPRDKMQIGALWQKDAGEKRILDFGSFHFLIQRDDWHLHFGDYTINVGQQLAFGGSYGSTFSLDGGTYFRERGYRWRPKSGADENAFLRGVHAGLESNGAWIMGFLSNNRIDATLHDDSASVKSFYTSGYHRTASELAKRDRFIERMAGISFGARNDVLAAGITLALSTFNLPLKMTTAPDSLRRSIVASIFHTWTRNHLVWQSETAVGPAGIVATQHALRLRPAGVRWHYGAVFYRYGRNFFSRHARAAGQTSAVPKNENGIYLNTDFWLFKALRFKSYYHTARPLLEANRFLHRKESWQAQLTYKMNDSELAVRYTWRRRRNHALRIHPDLLTQQWRLDLRGRPSALLELHTRLELSRQLLSNLQNPDPGLAMFVSLNWRLSQKVRIRSRWTQFDVADFDLRIYEFESGLPGSFENVLLNKRGYKWLGVLDIKSGQRWRITLRYREMYYPDESSLGNGADAILGNRKRSLAIQLAFKA